MPIRAQITIVFAIILLISFLSNFIINNVYLEEYYFLEKESLFQEIYVVINNSESAEQTAKLYQICVANNISLITASENMVFDIYISTNDKHTLINKNLEERLKKYVQLEIEDETTFALGKNYQIVRAYDEYLEDYYLEMYGRLSNGNRFLMRTPVSSIMESVSTINNFSYFSFICCICIGIFLINLLSNLITYPIEKLCNISQKMSDLDFSEIPVESKTKEVDELGKNLKHLSQSLDAALKKLQAANKQLEKDIDEKQQIDDIRKEFISNVSHELKTPIAVVQGYAEGLKECANEDERDFYCEVIVDEAQKMNCMVKQLIELNKLEFGQDDSSLVSINLKDFVCEITRSLDVLLGDISLEIIADANPTIIFDRFKLEQILTNYLTNAIHYVDKGRKIRIKITDGEKIRLSVFNSGSHIDENEIPKIWGKFYKVDKARTRTYGGSGIGLSIVSAIMKKYNEDFGVENVDGGVEFYIILRRADEK